MADWAVGLKLQIQLLVERAALVSKPLDCHHLLGRTWRTTVSEGVLKKIQFAQISLSRGASRQLF